MKSTRNYPYPSKYKIKSNFNHTSAWKWQNPQKALKRGKTETKIRMPNKTCSTSLKKHFIRSSVLSLVHNRRLYGNFFTLFYKWLTKQYRKKFKAGICFLLNIKTRNFTSICFSWYIHWYLPLLKYKESSKDIDAKHRNPAQKWNFPYVLNFCKKNAGLSRLYPYNALTSC